MLRILCVGTAVGAIIATGIVQGYWTGRWDSDQDRTRAAMPLERIPLELGEWQGQDYDPVSPAPEPLLGSLHRTYKNQKTGVTVYVTLVYGRHGPVSIHTPDVCYDAGGYRVGEITPYTVPGTSLELFSTEASKKRADNQTNLRIFWGWNAAGKWRISDNPRLAFARFPTLYKLYLVRELNTPGEPLADDPCLDLLKRLLPPMQQILGFRAS